MDAIVLVRKPKGMTSFAVVAKCRKIFHEKKIGHTGTLDPDAEGLMIVLLGRYTKLTPYCVKNHKHYLAEFRFGDKTDTGDVWGTVLDHKDPGLHTVQEVQAAADTLKGDILQIPPMVSAVKINGKKLYEYAREGKEIERSARPVHVDELRIEEESGVWKMDAVVSSGTYIRTLITDLGDRIGEYAAMSSLLRTGIESLSLSEANTLEDLETDPVFVEPIRVLDPAWPLIETKRGDDIRNGKKIHLNDAPERVILTENGQVLSAYEKKEDGLYHCLRGLF